MTDLSVKVLFRFSTKTGNIDRTMTGKGSAMMKLWALQNTTSTKTCVIIDRETGKVEFACQGSKDGFPKVSKEERLGNCEDIGIDLEYLHSIKDDRFDKEEV